MTNKFQITNFSSSNYFQPDSFEFIILGFGTYLFLVFCDLEFTNRITKLIWNL